MTTLDQAFQKAFAKGRAPVAPALESPWNNAAANYGLPVVSPSDSSPAATNDPFLAAYTPPPSFRLQSPDWLAGSRPAVQEVVTYPPVPVALAPVAAPVVEAPVAAPIALAPPPASPAIEKKAVEERPVVAPSPAPPATAIQSFPVSISLSGLVTTPSAPSPTQTAGNAQAKEEPKQLRVEGKQPIAAPHFGRAARHAGSKPREAPLALNKPQEKWPGLPAFDPIWEVDRLEWPAILDTLFTPDRAEWTGLMERIVQRAAGGRNLLAIAGCSPGNGTTTLAMGIARAAASRGMRVALIDANTESPALGDSLRLQTEIGWEQALIGERTLSETAVASLAEGVHVFPLGPECIGADVPWEDAVVEAFPLLATRHHLVVVDLGTIAGDEATPPSTNRLVSNSAGLALLIRDARDSEPSRAAAARRQLAAAGLELLGMVENYT